MSMRDGSPRRARLLGLLLLMTVFLAGALSGAALDRLLSTGNTGGEDAGEVRRPDRASTPDRRRPPLVERLELTPEQQAQWDSIHEWHSRRMAEWWEEHRPTAQALRDSVRTGIMDLLTPEQREVYEQQQRRRRPPHSPPDENGLEEPDGLGLPGGAAGEAHHGNSRHTGPDGIADRLGKGGNTHYHRTL